MLQLNTFLLEESKPRLIPVKVPWQVCPSTPFLRLTTFESGGPTEVKLVGYFALEKQEESIRGFESALVVGSPYDLNLSQTKKDSPFQLLKLTFEDGIWVKMSPSYADLEVIDESSYDWSALAYRYELGQDPDQWFRRFQEEWHRTSLCPNPRMYELEQSSWLEETGAGKYGSKHYLIMGHDAYAEVIANGWRWESEGALEGW